MKEMHKYLPKAYSTLSTLVNNCIKPALLGNENDEEITLVFYIFLR